jgi:RNA polymerase sigma-70 factor (ECF subfamily)
MADQGPENLQEARDFRQIVDQYDRKVYRHAFSMLGNREDAEEATQDVFLRVHKALYRFRGESSLSTWIYRITVNVCAPRVLRHSRKMVSIDDPEQTAARDLPDGDENPEGLYALKETRDGLGALVSRLPQREAAVVTLFYLDQKGYREIAEILELPEGSVARILFEARERLRKMIRQNKPPSESDRLEKQARTHDPVR